MTLFLISIDDQKSSRGEQQKRATSEISKDKYAVIKSEYNSPIKRLQPPSRISQLQPKPNVYWNPLDAKWNEDTRMTVAVFTTPVASIGGRSLNPLSEVDEEEFVTADGAEYLEESGIRETAGLRPNLSWVVPPAEVGVREIQFLGKPTRMRTYVGIAQSGNEIPRKLLINLATTKTDNDIAFGVTVQHRALYNIEPPDAQRPTLEGFTISDILGDEFVPPSSSVSTPTLILESGIENSADLAALSLGDLSLS